MTEFNIGDEVIRQTIGFDGKPFDDRPSVVVKVDLENRYLQCLSIHQNGNVMLNYYEMSQYRKTGKTYPEIIDSIEILKRLL